MNKKHYTPNLTEFYVGFEHEYFETEPVSKEKTGALLKEYNTTLYSEKYFKIIHEDERFWKHRKWVKKTSTAESIFFIDQKNYKKTGYSTKGFDIKCRTRVKHLNREDIESLGFEYSGRGVIDFYRIQGEFNMGTWTSYKLILSHHKKENRIGITAVDRGSQEIRFNGIIKNKSELKKILSWIGV